MVTALVWEKSSDYKVDVVDQDGLWKKVIGDLFEDFLPSRLQRLGARVISRFGCEAKNASSPNRLMPVAPEQALTLLFCFSNRHCIRKSILRKKLSFCNKSFFRKSWIRKKDVNGRINL